MIQLIFSIGNVIRARTRNEGAGEGKTSDGDKSRRSKKTSGIGELEILHFGTEVTSLDYKAEHKSLGMTREK
jgi:hypothetical protein